MQHYDPHDAPDCEEWLALDEQERIALARDYHGRARIRVPNVAVHAAVHAIVETQIALGEETPARRTAQRLMDEGLDRHEAKRRTVFNRSCSIPYLGCDDRQHRDLAHGERGGDLGRQASRHGDASSAGD